MSDKKPISKAEFRLSTPVRLGVAAVAACFIAGPALSNPVNPTVVNGTASFNQAGNVLTVTNSNGAIINWDKFSIKAGETTHFAQTSASSSVLNRVLNDPTAIYGTLSSNGRVWLVNPAGIMVGAGGRIDVAGFVASTLNISNADFLAGRNLFANDGTAQNVINQGEIKTPSGGSVYLIGANVSNEGIITTPQGETILAAGQTVSLIDSATPGVKVDITGAAGNATNLGQITAEAGRIGIAGVIVRNSGNLNASSVVSEGGRIFLKASQDAYVDGNGRIVTTGIRGGSVEVLGNRVAVMDNAEIDASGIHGGGRILVGGDYQGKNPDIQNASITYFGSNASLKADATGVGDGGTVIVWADDTTRAYGSISARGGATGGDGGFVEVSGHRYLDFHARVDTRAPRGETGTLLLDPMDVEIVSYGGTPSGDPYLDSNGGSSSYGGTAGVFGSTGVSDVSTLYWETIDSQLALSNVVVTTIGGGSTAFGDITLIDDHWYSSSNNLSLLAHRNINAANRTLANSSNGAITLIAGWDGIDPAAPAVGAGSGAINASGATFSTVGGNITLKAKNNITVGSLITTGYDGGEGSIGGHAGQVTVHSISGTINVTTIEASGGSGGDDSSFGGDGGDGGDGGTVSLTASGQITVGSIDATGGRGGDSESGYGGDGGEGGTINLTSTGGAAGSYIDASGGLGGDGGQGGGSSGWGGTITVEAYSRIALGWLNADTIDLTSHYGGSVGGLAISADIDNSDGGVSVLNAEVGNAAWYGGISLRVAGDSPSSVNIYDGALSQNSIYFSATQDINIDGDQNFSADNGGDITLYAGRDLNWTSDAEYTLGTSGNVILSAGRDIFVDDYIPNDASGSSLSLVAGRELYFTDSGGISDDWNDVILIGGTINNYGDISAWNDLDILAGNINNHGSMSAGNDLTFIAGNVLGADGGEGGGDFYAGHNITGFALGNITLGDGGYFHAGNDVNLKLMGAASTLSLSEGGYVLANAPSTITLDFTARSSGGVMIDGVETTESLPGGSGLFVLNHDTPATEGAGLVIKRAQAVATDPCASNPALCKPKDASESLIEDLVPKLFDTAKSDTDSDEGSFGDDDDDGKGKKKSGEGKDGKKDGKQSQKKAAQCT
jgi:filamentous hemagglutinin family protein